MEDHRRDRVYDGAFRGWFDVQFQFDVRDKPEPELVYASCTPGGRYLVIAFGNAGWSLGLGSLLRTVIALAPVAVDGDADTVRRAIVKHGDRVPADVREAALMWLAERRVA